MKDESTVSLLVKKILRVLLLSYVLLLLGAYFLSDRLMFPYSDSSYTVNASGLTVLTNETSSEQLAIRYWPVDEGSEIIMFFHGNAEDLGHLDGLASHFNQRGYHFISFDYRGYGHSTGQANETANHADAEYFYDHVIGMGFEPQEITLWGRSIGGGVATHLALGSGVSALVLESTFTSAFKTLVPFPVFPFDRFDNLSKIKRITSPTLIFHGEDDRIVPVGHATQLFQAAGSTKKELKIFQDTGHNNMWQMNSAHLIQAFTEFKSEL